MRSLFLAILLLSCIAAYSQIPAIPDSAANFNSDFHFQLTTVTQYHPRFSARYTGDNSLQPGEEHATTLTSTFFWGIQVAKAFEFYVNPEIAGGAGLSSAKGIAGFTNGEAFRVGNPAPTIYIARAYIRRSFNLGGEDEYFGESANQVNKTRTKKYFDLVLGKFSVADFFDNNKFSHDPRSQFFNWSLMSGGGWDYPANVRGYTWGAMGEYSGGNFKVRLTAVMVPTEANGNTMDTHIGKARSHALEFEKPYKLFGQDGTIRVLGFYTLAHMGSYALSLANRDITATRVYSRNKYGGVINVEQPLSDAWGLFARGSWNDGKNETWAFTEIDRSLAVGIVQKEGFLKRESDEVGVATVVNGLSSLHSRYLQAGGYGFIVGDGALNYKPEWITEVYYKINLFYRGFWLTPDYQFVLHPAYNADRGPASVFSIRAHIEL
ncbi:MAG TPA: carbohydrate porin [Cyclobacteriaceae bacterium]|nr:carbohydrate porin [Cyclobacteriaceae bacterium]